MYILKENIFKNKQITLCVCVLKMNIMTIAWNGLINESMDHKCADLSTLHLKDHFPPGSGPVGLPSQRYLNC